MKKRTLNQTWTLCLRMWQSISKERVSNKLNVSIVNLKAKWLKENGFTKEHIFANCFFCDFQDGKGCSTCPGRLVNSDFDCESSKYHYAINPPAFYKELLRLNRIRKAKK